MFTKTIEIDSIERNVEESEPVVAGYQGIGRPRSRSILIVENVSLWERGVDTGISRSPTLWGHLFTVMNVTRENPSEITA